MKCFLIKILLVVSLFAFKCDLNAQINNAAYYYDEILPDKNYTFNYQPKLLEVKINTDLNYSQNDLKKNKIDFSEIKFKAKDLAPFCRIELQLEKATNFPVKFRLGEVQYVEKMEGKY